MKLHVKSLLGRKSIAVLSLLFFFVLTITAQDRTPAAAYNEGLAELKAKNYEAGLVSMEEALSLAVEGEDDKVIRLAKKNGSVAAYNVAKAKKEAGSLEEAIAMYQKGIDFNPENPSNYAGKASVIEATGDMVAAVEAYILTGDAYAESKPDRAEKMYSRAQNIVGKLYLEEAYDEGIAAGNNYLAIKPENAEVNYYISRCLIEKGQNEDALKHADQAITQAVAGESDIDKYYIAKGLSLENLGRNAEAIVAYKKVTGEKYKKQAEYKIQKLGS